MSRTATLVSTIVATAFESTVGTVVCRNGCCWKLDMLSSAAHEASVVARPFDGRRRQALETAASPQPIHLPSGLRIFVSSDFFKRVECRRAPTVSTGAERRARDVVGAGGP